MSTQQIPSPAQIAAARAALWHQNSSSSDAPTAPAPRSVDAATDTSDPETDAAESSTGTASAETSSAIAETTAGEPGSDDASGPPEADTADSSADVDPETAAPDLARPDLAGPGDLEPAAPAPVSAAILTQSAARDFLNRAGLLLFAARPQFANIPAPTFVEATLGTANANPSLAASETARTLLARLVADGSAIPLNLLGLPSTTAEAPDFIVSAAAFPYIFTLRGDKAWKQPPSTSGPTKVSPLAANAYALLMEHGPRSAYALTGDLGKEITEAAVLRALSELWGQLRVLPVPQPGGKPTLWEPITSRFTKQIKTGANAGQPTALSTFISLYLGQAILATEDEIETFLSPLAARSRVRDVLHALSGARQLETVTVEGRHHLHIAGDLPVFAPARPSSGDVPVLTEDGSRIKKFVARPRKLGTGAADRPRPFRPPADRDRASRPEGDRQGTSRPGRRSAAPPRPAFNKPWEEEKQARTNRRAARPEDATPEYQDLDLDAASRPESPRRTGARSPGNKPTFGRGPGFGAGTAGSRRGGDRPAFSPDRAGRPPREGRPDRFQPRDSRRDFTPHPSAAGGQDRPQRRSSGDEAASGRPGFTRRPFDRERSAGNRDSRPFRRDDAAAGEGRPPRRPVGAEARSGAPGGRPPFSGKPRFSRDRDDDNTARPAFRKFDAPRGPRPPRDDQDGRPPRRTSDRDRPAPRSGGGAERPFRAASGAPPRREGFAPREGGRSFGRGSEGAPSRREGGFGKREGGFGKREGGFSGEKKAGAGGKPFRPRSTPGDKPFRKPLSRSAPDAPGASTFDKFKGNAKPWGKRPPARKYKPKEDEA